MQHHQRQNAHHQQEALGIQDDLDKKGFKVNLG